MVEYIKKHKINDYDKIKAVQKYTEIPDGLKGGGPMANTSATDVITSFQSTIRDRETIAAELQYQWFLDALGEFQLDISELYYNKDTQIFSGELPCTLSTPWLSDESQVLGTRSQQGQ